MKLGTSKRVCPVDSNYCDCPHQISEHERFSKIFPSSWLVCLFVGLGYYVLTLSVVSASSLCSKETFDTIVNMKYLGDLVEVVNTKWSKEKEKG